MFSVFNFYLLIELIFYFLVVVSLCCSYGLSLVEADGDYSSLLWQASHCSGFSCCGAQALGTWASVIAAHGLCSCGTQT